VSLKPYHAIKAVTSPRTSAVQDATTCGDAPLFVGVEAAFVPQSPDVLSEDLGIRTCGRPPEAVVVTPPLPSAVTALQLRTSISASFALKPAFGSVHDADPEAPTFVSSASMPGFVSEMVELVVERTFMAVVWKVEDALAAA